jgi:hypothetical protein
VGTPPLKRAGWKRYCLSVPTILFATGLSTASLQGQNLPPGTTIPARLQNTISTEKDSPGKTFTMKATQDIPLSDHQVIRMGARITGHILAAESIKKGEHESRLVLQFDTLEFSHQRTSIVVGLRAMASFMAVEEAEAPTNDPDMGPSSWTTQQIGGDVVYRGGGPVASSSGEVVGKPVSDGVMARLTAPREGTYPNNLHCSSDETLHALGLFASSACGVYGFSHLTIEQDGFTQPKGQIALVSSSKSVKVDAGSQFLLQVVNQ